MGGKNRIVVNYDDYEGLILLAAFKKTGGNFDFLEYGQSMKRVLYVHYGNPAAYPSENLVPKLK